jgi:hypothetical protein
MDKKCKKFQKMMDLYVCEMLSDTKTHEFESHIKDCSACSITFAKIRETYAFLTSNTEEKVASDWDTSWRKINKRLMEAKPSVRENQPFYKLRLAIVGAVVFFMVGLFVGRYFLFPPQGKETLESQLNRQLKVSLLEHIENIKPIIIQYSNSKIPYKSNQNLLIDREVASRFLVNNQLLQGQFSKDKNKRIIQLLEELEIILTEISNISQERPENLYLIRELIKIKGILMKIEVLSYGDIDGRTTI